MALNINGTTGISGVDGSVSAPAVTGTDSNTGITFPAADTIKFATGGVERMSITNSGFGGIIQGLTEFDYWYLTTSVTSDQTLTSNIIRNDRNGITPAERIGTGMSESSGIFTFPSTGKYLVFVIASFVINGSDSVVLDTMVTVNNSSYSAHSRATDGAGSGTRTGSGSSLALIDVTDTSQVKVKFDAGSIASGSSVIGTSSYISTAFIFTKIGET